MQQLYEKPSFVDHIQLMFISEKQNLLNTSEALYMLFNTN